MRDTDAGDPAVTLSDDAVILRPWSRDEAGCFADACADPAIRRYSIPHDRRGHPGPPLSITDAEAIIDLFAANWRAFAMTGTPSGVSFAIVDARSGEVAGQCGVDDWSSHDVAQIGYWLAPGARRRGYATRAVILLTRWLFELGAARVFLTIVEGNDASVAVARRAGFVQEGTMRSHGVWQGQRIGQPVPALPQLLVTLNDAACGRAVVRERACPQTDAGETHRRLLPPWPRPV